MRIAIVSTEFPPGPGGIGTHAFELARHLQSLRHTVHVFTSQDYCSEEEVLRFNDFQSFPIIRLSGNGSRLRKALERYSRIKQGIREFKPDVLLATGRHAVWLTALIADQDGLPWLAVGHGTEFTSRNVLNRHVSHTCYRRADGIVCVSHFTRNMMQGAGILPKHSWVIHNGADDQLFRRLPGSEVSCYVNEVLNLGGQRIITTVGRVCERKGQHIVIRALPSILDSVPNVHYVIAGLPERQSDFEAMARTEGVYDHVHFLGRIEGEDVVRLLNASDLFVMTSIRTSTGDVEGFGISVIEAALCGVPSIVSQGSGLTEAIQEGETGISVPEGNIGATAYAITSLLKNDVLRNRMAMNAKRRAEKEQTWYHVAEQFEAVLKELVLREETRTAPQLI